MNPFSPKLLTIILSVTFALGCIGCSESGDSAAMTEDLLHTEVELLSERLETLDQEMDLQVLQLEKDQRSLVRDASMDIRDLSEANLTLKVERFLLSPEDFSQLLENGSVSDLYPGIQKLVSENQATAKSIVIASLTTTGISGDRPQFSISDQKDLNIPIAFESVAGDETENPAPKLAPKEWSKSNLGMSLSGSLLARDDDRYLLALEFEDSIRLKNERYPFPKIFVENDPGHLEMPVFHQGNIDTTIKATLGVAEFIGTTNVPGFESTDPEKLQAVFINIFSATK